MIVYVLLLFLLAVQSVSAEHEALRKVFGEERVRTHYPDEESLKFSINAAWRRGGTDSAAKDIDDSTFYLACSEYAYGRDAKLFLSSKYEETNVHTAFSSAKEDETCFVVFATAASIADVSTPFLKTE